MSKVAAAHGGEDHTKASSFMSDTLDKASRPCFRPISSSLSINLSDGPQLPPPDDGSAM